MNKPSAQHEKNLYCPKISQNRSIEFKESCQQFMKGIKNTLDELGIYTNNIESFETYENGDGRVIRYRLGVKNDSHNLINFFSKGRIGYRYNKRKQKRGNQGYTISENQAESN